MIATASPRSAGRISGYGADEVVDYTATPVAEAVTVPVDVVLHLVTEPADALLGLLKPDGVFLTTTTPAPDGAAVRTVRMYLRSDAAQLAELVAKVDAGTLDVYVGERRPLSDLAAVHEQAAAGKLAGKVVLVP